MAFDYTAAENILKKIYKDEWLEDVTNKNRPLLASIAKNTNASGEKIVFPTKYGNPQTVATSFSTAKTAAASEASKYARFEVPYISKHAVQLISGDAMSATRADEGAFVKALKSEIDGMLNQLSNRRAAEVFSAGWGEVGTVETGSISGATLKLTNRSEMARIEKGVKLVFSSALSSATLRDSGQALTVSAVDRSTKTITFTENVSEVNGLVAGDYVFIQGDRENSATPTRQCLLGLEAWIPPYGYDFSGESVSKFCNVNRSEDVTRLAGHRQDSQGENLTDAMQLAGATVASEGGAIDLFVVSPRTFNAISTGLGPKVRYQDVKASARVGFSSLMITGYGGDVNVIQDPWCPDTRMYGLTRDSWELVSDGMLVRPEDKGMAGGGILHTLDDDSVQINVVSRRAQLVCHNPAHNINILITAQ